MGKMLPNIAKYCQILPNIQRYFDPVLGLLQKEILALGAVD